MMNKSLRGRDAKSSSNVVYGFRGSSSRAEAKKEPPETGGFES